MIISQERFARYKNRKPYFAECEVTVEYPSATPDIVFDCNGYGFTGQGYIESVSEKGYDDWKAGAKVGVEFALLIAKATHCRAVITRIEGMATETNPTIIGFTAAIATWKALEFAPSEELIARLEDQVFESWSKSHDEVPIFI
jgi:hypothetical protein